MQDFSHYELAEIHQLIKIPSFNCFIVEIRLRGDNSASPDGTLRGTIRDTTVRTTPFSFNDMQLSSNNILRILELRLGEILISSSKSRRGEN
jgi:hypothetical protein